MSFPVRAFENGEWVERLVDINHFVSSNREQQNQGTSHRIPPPAQHPVVGFLTRTVLRSPVINSILPLRCRQVFSAGAGSLFDDDLIASVRGVRRDVVFVGDDFIHLKEIDHNGHLHHISTKADYNARIRAAKVFGDSIEDVDGTTVTNGKKLHASIGNANSDIPQIIIMTLESQELSFTYPCENKRRKLIFRETRVPLPNPKSILLKPGKHLAVDPKSRAFAIGAAAGMLVLYNAKTKKQMKDDFIHDGENWNPTNESRAIQIQGMILKLDFLCPPDTEEEHISLVLVVSRGSRSWLQYYEWKYAEGLRTFAHRHTQALMAHERLPLMLIPFSRTPRFSLVFEHSIQIIENISTGGLSRRSIKLSYPENSPQRTGLCKPALLTNWARPARNKTNSYENLYLVREDGVVHYLQIAERKIGDTSKAGNLRSRAGNAFAVFDISLKFPDFLIYSGDLCRGKIFSIGTWPHSIEGNNGSSAPKRVEVMTPNFLGCIPNWAPIFDMLITDVHCRKMIDSQNKIFVTSGREGPKSYDDNITGSDFQGAVTELRYGYEARIGGYFLEQPELNGSTGLWTIDDVSQEGIFILLSMPLQTSLLHVSSDLSCISVDYSESNCGLDFVSETITAGILAQNIFVQVTRSSIVLVDKNCHNGLFERVNTENIPKGAANSVALLLCELQMIAIVTRFEDENMLSLRKLIATEVSPRVEQVGSPLKGTYEATCITSFRSHNRLYLCLGRSTGTVEIYYVDEREGLVLILDHHIRSPGNEVIGKESERGICESMVVLCQNPMESSCLCGSPLLVCGLRNGDLYCIELDITNSQIKDTNEPFTQARAYTIPIGHTPVSLIPDMSDSRHAVFVMCGASTLYLTYPCRGDGGIAIGSIWYTDQEKPYYQQNATSTIARIPKHDFLELDLQDALICTSGSNFLICQLDQVQQPVPRHFPVLGSPNRLLYAAPYDLLVVATRTSPKLSGCAISGVVKEDSQSSRALLQLLSFDGPNGSCQVKTNFQEGFEANERIYALTDWEAEDNDGILHYHIVVGTRLDKKGSSSPSGRILIFQRQVGMQGQIFIRICDIIKCPEGPVYAIATHGRDCMLISAGKSLIRCKRAKSTGKWHKVAGAQITSLGARVAISGSYAHVATSADSFQSYGLETTSDSEPMKRICSDGQARNSASILPISFHFSSGDTTVPLIQSALSTRSFDENIRRRSSTELVLLSDKAGSIAGFLFSPDAEVANAAPLLFEATFVRSITVLRYGSVRPPWRRSTSAHCQKTHSMGYNRNGPSHSQKPHGVLVDEIVGSSTDGTIISASIVNEHAWRLLSLLTRACTAQKHYATKREDKAGRTAQFSMDTERDKDKTKKQDIDRNRRPTLSLDINIDPDNDTAGLRRKLAYHINGDILAQVLEEEEDPQEALAAAIDGQLYAYRLGLDEEDRESGVREDYHGYDRRKGRKVRMTSSIVEEMRRERWKRLAELVQKALPAVLYDLYNDDDDDGTLEDVNDVRINNKAVEIEELSSIQKLERRRLIRAVTGWLKELLMPVL